MLRGEIVGAPGLLTCCPHTAEAVLSSIACDLSGEAQVPQADLALVALQSLACRQVEGKQAGEGRRQGGRKKEDFDEMLP